MRPIDTASIKITNNISVCVPAPLHFMTTFVLREQNDWFEDEIKFIRHFVRPGMKVIDIGANYGLYTLTIAKIIGNSGSVWAFEPTEMTATCLKKSILENQLSNITLIQAGLSDRSGTARLFTSPNSELNSLSRHAASGGQCETIRLFTLDQCKHRYGWKDIDFIKLDAEGEEIRILDKSQDTLCSMSPLVMFELKHGDKVNLPLIHRFEDLGYSIYRLIPALNILVRFEYREPFDGALLNLFACKGDREEALASEGVLVKDWKPKDAANNSLAAEYIGGLAFGPSLSNLTGVRQIDDHQAYYAVLNAYINSLSESASASDRLGYLMGALRDLRKLLAEGEHRIERLVTFSRIAFDAGERELGVRILSHLIGRHAASMDFEIEELLLPASDRYDSIIPKSRLKEWLLSSVLEQYVLKHAFSCYFSGKTTLPLFEQLQGLGFMSDGMRNRFQVVQTCFSQ